MLQWEHDVKVSAWRTYRDPVKAWKALEEMYGVSMDGVQAVLFTQIMTMKYMAGTPIQMHHLKMEEIRQKLTAAGQSIPDLQFLSYFLNSLPSELDQFSTTVNHTTETVASVTMRLRQIELRQELCGEGGMGLLAKSKGKGGGTKTRRGKCNNCGEAGHWAHDCMKPKKKNNANGSTQGSTQVPVGHMFTAVNAKAAGYEGTTTYYLDSGASNHYTPCQEDLQDYTPFSAPHMINMAKGHVQAIGVGTVRYMIQLKDGTEGFSELQDVTWMPGISARLLSVCQLAGSGYTAAFKQSGCELRGPGGNTINIPVVQQVYPVQLRIKSVHTNGTANLMFTECNNMQLAKWLEDEWLMTATAHTEITWLDLQRMMGHLNLHDYK